MHARRRSTPEQRRRWDLSNLQFIMSGAEPIKAHTMTTFFTTFAECGLKPSVFCSAYGLAEHVCGEPIASQQLVDSKEYRPCSPTTFTSLCTLWVKACTAQ